MSTANYNINKEESTLDALKSQLALMSESMKPMHLKMALALAEGKTQEEAYVESGGKGKDPRSAASNIIKTNQNISTYISTAKAAAALASQEQLVGTVDHKRRVLWDIAKESSILKVTLKNGKNEDGVAYEVFDATSAKTAVSAIAELNKMDGDLAAIVNKNENIHSFSDLTDEELEKKIEALHQAWLESLSPEELAERTARPKR